MKSKMRFTVLAMLLVSASLAGCQQHEGPAQKAGKNIDQAANKAAKATGNAVNEAGKKIQQAGNNIKNGG
ncbi:hypothetical protein [Acidihalobacter ferrooxydans]|uniref:Entericidin EcnAB n=1 Tax=Acidihalobacter ferrooxydans TaxID=1765967 RepID=A0A1P8UEQ5_9GAMM|nr:hypothetical protein [Acidihalobacter ferrooxydans]APZ42258.1 hypothetical protein BW247_03430 [Acidihalobacter ferrooxydans]